MTQMPTPLPDDQGDRFAKLESQIARSRGEIVKLTQIILDTRSAPSAPAAVSIEREQASPIDDKTRRAMFDVMAMSLHLTRVPFVMRFSYFRKRHQRRLAKALLDGQLIAPDWYREAYPEVAESGLEPAIYFAAKGIAAGHVPHPKFRQEAST